MGPAAFRRRPSLRSARVLALAALAAIVLVAAGPASPPASGVLSGRVVAVVDGDTIRVHVDGHVEKVRYIGINTPEIHHPRRGEEPGGRQAREVNRRLVEGQPVQLELDVQSRDRYGRLLAYVWLAPRPGPALMVNAELVRLGYAQVMTVPPNVRHADLFRARERQAREERRGLWSQ